MRNRGGRDGLKKWSLAYSCPVPLAFRRWLKIMANENMDEWRMRPGVVMETVSATKKFLEERPEEAKKYGQAKCVSTGMDFGGPIIARFLGWDQTRVARALADLKAIAEGKVEREAIEMMPTQRASEKLRKEIKSLSKSQPVPAEVNPCLT